MALTLLPNLYFNPSLHKIPKRLDVLGGLAGLALLLFSPDLYDKYEAGNTGYLRLPWRSEFLIRLLRVKRTFELRLVKIKRKKKNL